MIQESEAMERMGAGGGGGGANADGDGDDEHDGIDQEGNLKLGA